MLRHQMHINRRMFVCIVLFSLLQMSAQASSVRTWKQHGIDIGDVVATPDLLLRTDIGMSENDFKALYGLAAHHQLTLEQSSSLYRVFICNIDMGSDDWFFVVFKNHHLESISKPSPSDSQLDTFQDRYYPKDESGQRPTKRLPVDPMDDIFVHLSMEGTVYSKDDLARHIEHSHRPDDKGGTHKGPIAIATRFLRSLAINRSQEKHMLQQVRRDYKKNANLLREYDGSRVTLSMTPNEVDILFGAPLHIFTTASGLDVRIYGRDIGLGVYPGHAFSNVAVVFDSNVAVRVISGSFFCQQWIPSSGISSKKEADAEQSVAPYRR